MTSEDMLRRMAQWLTLKLKEYDAADHEHDPIEDAETASLEEERERLHQQLEADQSPENVARALLGHHDLAQRHGKLIKRRTYDSGYLACLVEVSALMEELSQEVS